jgi:adenosine deaminase
VLIETIRALPKIELHRHLEGTVRLETLVEIAREYGIQMPEYTIETLRPFVQMTPDQPYTARNFLSKFQTLRQFYRSIPVVRRVAREAIEDAAADNVRYMELRFSPQALSNIIGCTHYEMIELMCETARSASIDFDIDVRLLVTVNRHEGIEIGERILDAALPFRDHGVVGLDLAGAEADFPAEPFAQIFRRAKDAGLGSTVHAGEWAGAQSVHVALEMLAADRIGHGVRVLEDSTVLQRIIKRGIVLEVCPTSNVQSGVVPSLTNHPLPELYGMRVRTTLNTDDPLVCNITLSDELMVALTMLNMTLDDVKQHMLNAASAVFLPPSERDALVSRFTEWYADRVASDE